jgi:hypothetical protein
MRGPSAHVWANRNPFRIEREERGMITGPENASAHQEGLSETVWKTLYQDALFEVDSEALTKKIDAAQKAIGERSLALLRGNGD